MNRVTGSKYKQTFIDPTPDRDHTSSGIIVEDTVGETVSFGECLYLKSDGKYWKADSNNGDAPASGKLVIANGSITADNSGPLVEYGYVRDDTWNWTVGATLYISATAGDLTESEPEDYIRKVGYAYSADIVFFDPSSYYAVKEIAELPLSASAVSSESPFGATLTTNGHLYVVYQFEDGADRQVRYNIVIPNDMLRSEDSYLRMYWSSPSTSSNASIRFYYLITAPGDSTDQTGTNDSGNIVTSSGTSYGMVVSDVVTISGGTIQDDEVCIHTILQREGAEAADTLGDILELHAVSLRYYRRAVKLIGPSGPFSSSSSSSESSSSSDSSSSSSSG